MLKGFINYFSISQFMPHGHCYLWKPSILWLHFFSDLIIALSYFSIPVMLYYYVYKKNKTNYGWLFKLFAAFIFFCGLTHLIAIWTIWKPVCQIEGIAKGITAIISSITALCLLPNIPKLLSLRSPDELETINMKLKIALEEKDSIETQLLEINKNLEDQVKTKSNELLQCTYKIKVANEDMENFEFLAKNDENSPIRSLQSLLHELKKSSDSINTKKEITDNFEININKLNNLIVNMLNLAKIVNTETLKEWVNLIDIIDEAKASLFQLIEESGARIYIDNLFDVYCNKPQIISVFKHILENSINYSSSGKKPEIIISSMRDKFGFYFEIKDNGIGMKEEDLRNIFKPFSKTNKNLKKINTSSNLSICEKIIINHGGKISAISFLGEGTTLKIFLPLHNLRGDKL
jgi:signal transduction histidine kinase